MTAQKSTYIFSLILMGAILLLCGTAYFAITHQMNSQAWEQELDKVTATKTLSLQTSVERDIALVRKWADSTVTRQFFLDPKDEYLKKLAFDEFESYRKAFIGGNVFWVPDETKDFYNNGDYAYTVDGAEINHVDYKNFNAQSVKLSFEGVSVHPGEGKNALINAVLLMHEFIASLPQNETPYDANYDEGYWHINDVSGTSVACECSMILREFDKLKLDDRDKSLYDIRDKILAKYPKAKINIEITDQYTNMAEYIKNDPRPLFKAIDAIKKNGLEPVSNWIKGGTDGATFSKMGLVIIQA